MMRSHAMSTAEVGVWLGMTFGLGGIVGTLFGGYAAARWCPDDERRQMIVTALGFALFVPCFALFLFLPGKDYALGAFVPCVLLLNVFGGPIFALLQRLVVDEMRATTVAVVMLLANLIGLGGGPQIVGVVSDTLARALGADSLRYAMLIVSLASWWSAYHFWQVGRTVKGDLRMTSGTAPGTIQHTEMDQTNLKPI
jgi:predicted MFS family arabinose efflux permease